MCSIERELLNRLFGEIIFWTFFMERLSSSRTRVPLSDGSHMDLLTKSPDKSEYFFAGLKEGGASMLASVKITQFPHN